MAVSTSRNGGGSAWTQADTIDEVLERMEAIRDALPPEDGVATFNRMYTQTTIFVRTAIENHEFGAGTFLERLDVHFANLFFEAYRADEVGDPVPTAWAPLFNARAKPRTHPIQFALAGMNAHICHDLPSAVVVTCRELGIAPIDDSPEHLDFSTTNGVLEQAKDDIKSWFTSGIVATIDEVGGRLDDGLAMFGIHAARAAAWQVSQLEWDLADNPRLDALFRENLARGVAIASRGILL
jgi:hypothetical protein